MNSSANYRGCAKSTDRRHWERGEVSLFPIFDVETIDQPGGVIFRG